MADLTIPAIEVASSQTEIVPPDINDLTTVAVDGQGAFDIIMRSVKLHLQDEYNNNRIVGKEYADVYLGSIQAVLQQSVQFLTNTVQMTKLNAEIALIRQQTVTELSRTSDDLLVGLGFNTNSAVAGSIALQDGLVEKQIEKLTADITNETQKTTDDHNLALKTIEKTTSEIANLDAHTVADINLINGQISKLSADTTAVTVKTPAEVSLLEKQEDKIDADIADRLSRTPAEVNLITKQATKVVAETSNVNAHTTADIALIAEQKDKVIAETDSITTKYPVEVTYLNKQVEKITNDITDQHSKIISDIKVNDSQISKMRNECILLGQKTVTELAQTCDTMPTTSTELPDVLHPWLNNSSLLAGISKQQKDLYNAQKEGFTRDAEQKLAKIMVDAWAVAMGADQPFGIDGVNAGVVVDDISQVVAKAKTGLGI